MKTHENFLNTAVLALLSLIAGLGVALGADTQPTTRPLADALAVDVRLAGTTTVPGGSIDATFRVTNTSKAPRQIGVMNCSWGSEWKTDSAHVHTPMQDCKKNFMVTETLAPGAVYEQSGELSFDGKTPTGDLKFKVGFTSGESTETLWSKELVVTIKPK